MSDRALRYFLAVARTGSIRGAAEALNVAASAVSRQIADLEAQFGSVLLERLPRGVVPTEAGRIVAEHAQSQAEDSALLADRLRRLRGVRQGTVRLCCGAGFAPDLLEHGLAGFSRDHDSVVYHVSMDTTDGILASVASGESDIGLAYNPPAHPELRSAAISRQPILAVVPPNHERAGSAEPCALKMFADAPAALLPADHGVRQLLGRVEADGGFRLAARLETPSFELQRRFVIRGMGVAFLPRFAVAIELHERTLASVALADTLLIEATAHLLVRAGRRLPDAVEGLLDRLAQNLVAFQTAL